MQFTDKATQKIAGHFHLEVMRNGKIVEVTDEPNLVVDLSKFALSRLVGGVVAGHSITSLGMGTAGSAPAAGNTSLSTPFTKAFDSITYPANNQTQFNFSISDTEANGLAIMEFGLFTASGALFARKVRATPLNKESDISFSGSWILTFK